MKIKKLVDFKKVKELKLQIDRPLYQEEAIKRIAFDLASEIVEKKDK